MMRFLGGQDAAGAQRATETMLEMRKIDLALETSYGGTVHC